MASSKKSAATLEAALPGVLKKIKALHASLNPDEKAILTEIVSSAAEQAVRLSPHEAGHADVAFEKSMSIHASADIRQGYINLAKELKKHSG
jgi:hypothetical protein